MRRFPWLAATAVGALALLAVAAPVLRLPDPVHMDIAARMAAPSAAHLLGRDEYGRDVLSRLIWGGRTSLAVALASATLACVAGTLLGVVGGFMRGIAELLAVRSMDVVLCFPPLLLALLVVTLLGPGAGTLIPVLAVLFLPGFTRVAYAGVLSARSLDYVEAVRALGAGPWRIMLRTILPAIGGPVLVQFSLAAAAGVLLESGLSFLGLGVVPPTPSWGLMIGAARTTMNQDPALLLWPCLALTLTILAMNAFCDGLRDAVDPHPAAPRLRRRFAAPTAPTAPLPEQRGLALSGLTVEIATPTGSVRPVRDISLHVEPGETLAIVGESGSGKSLTGLAVMGLLPPVARVASGAIDLDGTDLVRLDETALRQRRGAEMAMVFQDPGSSLNPVHRVGAQIVEAIRAHQKLSERAARDQALALLRRVGIPDAVRRLDAFPHELSGGMRQRVMIAMAIANSPHLLIADEPTTALDVTLQAQVLELLADLQRERRLALLFITHSLPVVAEIADRVTVMYAGEIVEQGAVAEVFARPLHPYTAALLASVPAEEGPPPRPIPGVVPSPHALPPGCAFAPRCPRAVARCNAGPPSLMRVSEGRLTRCIRWAEA